MSYPLYKVNEANALVARTGTDGYQPKFLVDNKAKFVKVQCSLQGGLRNDWRVEDIASRICTQLGIYHVSQFPCNVQIKTKRGVKSRKGVVSRNFELDGYSFVSFNSLAVNSTFSMDMYNCSDVREKLNILADTISRQSGLNIQSVILYLFAMVTVDILVLNQDRHFSNFGVFFNNYYRRYEIAMLFDFGMGLFENSVDYDTLGLDMCLRSSYIEPFSEDPFDLIEQLKLIPVYCRYLKNLNLSRLKLDTRLFPSSKAYSYYVKAKEALLHG